MKRTRIHPIPDWSWRSALSFLCRFLLARLKFALLLAGVLAGVMAGMGWFWAYVEYCHAVLDVMIALGMVGG